MDILFFKLLAGVGILLISGGIIARKKKFQDYLFISGGACMEIYSIWLEDIFFMILQLIFIGAAVYDLLKK